MEHVIVALCGGVLRCAEENGFSVQIINCVVLIRRGSAKCEYAAFHVIFDYSCVRCWGVGVADICFLESPMGSWGGRGGSRGPRWDLSGVRG